MPVRGFELMLKPGYYRDYLENKYPGEFSDPAQAFLSIDGCTDFPELVLVLKQIANFQGTGAVAQLYYESKAAEALSHVIEHSRTSGTAVQSKPLYRQDRINLDAVKSYIDDHFTDNIKTEQLTAIACMGKSKLRASVKLSYGSTITEYIQNRRIGFAEGLLTKTDFSIGQVAEAVGYHHGGRFPALFKKHTGLSPEEYRKIMYR